MQYDIAGNAVSVTDPKNNPPTVFDFSDRYGVPDSEARDNSQYKPELGSQSTYAFATLVPVPPAAGGGRSSPKKKETPLPSSAARLWLFSAPGTVTSCAILRFEDEIPAARIAQMIGVHPAQITRALKRAELKLSATALTRLRICHRLAPEALKECVAAIFQNPERVVVAVLEAIRPSADANTIASVAA